MHFEPAPPLTQRPDSCVGIFQFQSFHVIQRTNCQGSHKYATEQNLLQLCSNECCLIDHQVFAYLGSELYLAPELMFASSEFKFPRNKCILGACFRSARNSLYFRESSTTTRRVSNKLWKGVLSRVVCFHYPSKSIRDCHQ